MYSFILFPFYLTFIDLIIPLGIINYTLILLLNIYLVIFKNTIILINNESDFYLFLSPFNNFVKFHKDYKNYKILNKIYMSKILSQFIWIVWIIVNPKIFYL